MTRDDRPDLGREPVPGNEPPEAAAPEAAAPGAGVPEAVAPDAAELDSAAPGAAAPSRADGARTAVTRLASAIEGALDTAVEATARRWSERPGARVRRVRRLGRASLPFLYDVHPEARQAAPRELGVQTIAIDGVAGTAVGPANQRGGDFLPLRPFRSPNWMTRWQRVRSAVERLAVLPPIEVVRFADRFWVLDGHNRIAAALYSGQLEIDADITELVPLDASLTGSRGPLESLASDARELRKTVSRRRLGQRGGEGGDDDRPRRGGEAET